MLILSLASCIAAADGAESKSRPLPKRAKVEEIVQQQFKKLGRQTGDLISQGDVKPIFIELERAGWKVADQAEILKLVPTDSEPLVRQFRSPTGKAALQGWGGQTGVYDRFDRMLAMPDGERFLRDVLSWPSPAEMLKTMGTTDQGADLAASLNNAPRTKEFTRPTGRLYTPAAFSARLLASYAAAVKKRP